MKGFAGACALLGIMSVVVGALLLPGFTRSGCRIPNDRYARGTLRSIASAQEDFREHDRDGDGRRGFWRRDVAGLYALVPPGEREMIKLIEVTAAGADLRAWPGWEPEVAGPGLVDLSHYAIHAPMTGYWFAALPFEDETDARRDPRRFAVCAVPDSLSAGRVALALTQDGVLWRRPVAAGRAVPAYFPIEPAVEGWRKAD